MTKKIYYSFLITILLFLSLFYYKNFIRADESLLSKTRGKIVLQVEENGEAWYIDPNTDTRMYLRRPIDAYYTMRNLGIGITNENIKKFPLAEINLEGEDDDQDGLSNRIETALGTDPEKKDSDQDGYGDREEILNNYDPNGTEKMPIDVSYSKKYQGRIFLQTELNGEGWYINPNDGKRCFLGSPTDAFEVMRQLGLGISNENLYQIPEYKLIPEAEEEYNNNQNNNEYSDNLKRFSNEKYSFRYPTDWKVLKNEKDYNMVLLGNYDRDPFLENKGVISVLYIKTDNSVGVEELKTGSKPGYKLEEDEILTINDHSVMKEIFKYSNMNNYEISATMQIDENEFFKLIIMSPGKQSYNNTWNTILETVKFK